MSQAVIDSPTRFGFHSASSQAAPFSTPEQIFCRDLIVAYIGNGRCPPEKLTETINYIRVAWNRTYGGNDGTFFANEAGQRHHLQAAE